MCVCCVLKKNIDFISIFFCVISNFIYKFHVKKKEKETIPYSINIVAIVKIKNKREREREKLLLVSVCNFYFFLISICNIVRSLCFKSETVTVTKNQKKNSNKYPAIVVANI